MLYVPQIQDRGELELTPYPVARLLQYMEHFSKAEFREKC